MTPANKAKGDKAEREAAELLSWLTGHPVRRMLGAGRQDDRGDLEGLPGVAVQVAYWPSRTLAAYVEKPDDAAEQAVNSGLDLGVAMIRHKGSGNRPGIWRFAMTPVDFSVLLGYAERGGLGK